MSTITIETIASPAPIALVAVMGDLDASNYLELISLAKSACEAGARYILLDLSGTKYMSSSGLVALHSMALMLQGEQPLNPEDGWSALHAVGQGIKPGTKQAIKLLNPNPKVERVLEIAGLKDYFEIFTDRETAIRAFSA